MADDIFEDIISCVDDDNFYNDTNEGHWASMTFYEYFSRRLTTEKILEVTRKLVSNTDRDPDRDLRKRVLLKTVGRQLSSSIANGQYQQQQVQQHTDLHQLASVERSNSPFDVIDASTFSPMIHGLNVMTASGEIKLEHTTQQPMDEDFDFEDDDDDDDNNNLMSDDDIIDSKIQLSVSIDDNEQEDDWRTTTNDMEF